jgi:hypothetical protein
MGDEAPATWTLIVNRAGQAPQRFENLPNVHPAFKTLEWLGFTCSGTAVASGWLDDLVLKGNL